MPMNGHKKTKGTRWIKIKNLKTKNRDRDKEHIQGYRDLRELLSKGMHDLLN